MRLAPTFSRWSNRLGLKPLPEVITAACHLAKMHPVGERSPAVLAAALWMGMKLSGRRDRVPKARHFEKYVGVPAADILAAEVAMCRRADWALMRVISPTVDVDLSAAPVPALVPAPPTVPAAVSVPAPPAPPAPPAAVSVPAPPALPDYDFDFAAGFLGFDPTALFAPDFSFSDFDFAAALAASTPFYGIASHPISTPEWTASSPAYSCSPPNTTGRHNGQRT